MNHSGFKFQKLSKTLERQTFHRESQGAKLRDGRVGQTLQNRNDQKEAGKGEVNFGRAFNVSCFVDRKLILCVFFF